MSKINYRVIIDEHKCRVAEMLQELITFNVQSDEAHETFKSNEDKPFNCLYYDQPRPKGKVKQKVQHKAPFWSNEARRNKRV